MTSPPSDGGRSHKYVWDALKAGRQILRFTAGKTFSDYERDDILQAAVERQFEILGEAFVNLRRVTPDVSAGIHTLPAAIAFRNVIAHRYADIDQRLVWSIVVEKLPALVDQLASILGPPDQA